MRARDLLLDNGYDDVNYLTNYSYDDAIIGVTTDDRVVYDFNKMVTWLCKELNIDRLEAIEHIENNTLKQLPFFEKGAPLIMYPIERE